MSMQCKKSIYALILCVILALFFSFIEKSDDQLKAGIYGLCISLNLVLLPELMKSQIDSHRAVWIPIVVIGAFTLILMYLFYGTKREFYAVLISFITVSITRLVMQATKK